MFYTIVVAGKPEGPYSLESLKGMDILPGTFVRKPGMDDYKEAHEFPELRELFGFGFQHTAPQYFASFDQRLLAWAIDYFFVVMGYVFLALLCYVFVDEQELRISLLILGLPLIPIGKLVYGTISEASEQQASIGKRLLNIRVSDFNGQRISLPLSLKRNLAKIASTLPFFIGYLYCFLNKKQQCFHDSIVGTLMIKDRLI